MNPSYWLRQSPDKPLFSDLVWSRPENRSQAGKLLIISGDASGFAIAAQAYQASVTAGAGVVRVILPDFLRPLVPKQIQFELDYAPAIKHGGFSKSALGNLLEHALWADAVLVPGGIGRNSETSAMLEQFVHKCSSLLVIAEDALDIFIEQPNLLFARPKTIVVADFSQLQKMWQTVAPGQPAITYDMPLQVLVEALHELTKNNPAALVTQRQDVLFVSYGGQVSTTPFSDKIWRVQTASASAVWAMQHSTKLFEAITTSFRHLHD